MPRSMITTWTGRQKWNWSSTQFYPRPLQSRSQVTYNYGLQEMNSETKKLHYASYDKKKSRSKENKTKSFSSLATKSYGSTSQNPQSTSSGRLCYRCRKPYTKEHEAVCKAKIAKCNGYGEIGHYKNCCKKTGNFPKKPQHTKKMHITGIDEEGNRVTVSSQHMLSMKHSRPQQDLLIQFGIRKDFHSIDKKVTLKLDTSADVNAFNRTTFRRLFPDVELQSSVVLLENFDKTMVKPMLSMMERQSLQDPGRSDGLWWHSQCLIMRNNLLDGNTQTLFHSQKGFRDSRWNNCN